MTTLQNKKEKFVYFACLFGSVLLAVNNILKQSPGSGSFHPFFVFFQEHLHSSHDGKAIPPPLPPAITIN